MFNDPFGAEADSTAGRGGAMPMSNYSNRYGAGSGHGAGPNFIHSWSDGWRYSDWSANGGSKMYRDALARGGMDIGGIVYNISSGNRTAYTEYYGQVGVSEDYSFTDYSQTFENNGTIYVGVAVIGTRFVVAEAGQGGPNIYAEISNSFDEEEYDWMFGDGGGLAATFYAKGNYSVFKKGDKYYFSASAGMRTLASHRGDITPEGKALLIVNGKEFSATNFTVPDGTSLSSKYYTSLGSVLVELPTTGTVSINLNFSYHIVFGSQGQTHSATLTVPVYLRTIGFPRD